MMSALLVVWTVVRVGVIARATTGVSQSFGAANTTLGNSISASTTTATGSGDLLVAAIMVRNTASLATVAGITDSAANPWVKANAITQGTQADGELWYSRSAAGVTGVTATVTGAAALALTVLDVTGASATVVDKTATSAASSTAATTGTTASTA
jgi:hypothetical protein